MAIIEGYFDESGDLEAQPGVFCVAGYFIATDAAIAMDREWGEVLDAYNLPFFHMVDCAHGNENFANLTLAERIELVSKLIALIKKYTAEGIAFITRASSYDPPESAAPDPYSYCAAGCADSLKMFLHMNRIDADIAFFFEEGHKNKGNAYGHIAKTVKREGDSLTFAAKEKVRLLQAADLLAWQAAKYAKDYSFARWVDNEEPKRPPRKDFSSLMEHHHSFMYIEVGKSMNIEIWPMNKRATLSSSLTFGRDGPITYYRENGDDLPIIPVERAIGWRMGGGRFIQLAFGGFGGFENKPFALAFDEPRFFEALGLLIHATEAFEGSEMVPVLSAEDLSIEEREGQKMLRIKMQGGASIGLHLSPETTSRLKEIIRQMDEPI